MAKDDLGAKSDDITRADSVAVGIVATAANTDAVTRTILRSNRCGHSVFVGHFGDETLEAVIFAERLGATIVDPIDDNPDRAQVKQALAVAAQMNSCEGLLMQSADGERIDFNRSVGMLEESRYSVQAVPETPSSVTSKKYLLVGIPAYNEDATIGDVVAEATEYANEVLVADDGSTDDTAEVAASAGATVVTHASNRGYGAALQTLFAEAHRRRVDHLVIIDGDGQHKVADVPRLVERQQKTGSQVVIGSRFVGKDTKSIPLVRRVGLLLVNILTRLSLGMVRSGNRIRDTQSGFRVYGCEAIASLTNDAMISDRMGASTDILYHAHTQRYCIEEVETEVSYNVQNGSTHDPLSHGMVLLHNIVKTVESRRPMTILGIPGVILASLGAGFSYWTIINYVNSGSFGYGLAITSTFFVLAGIFTVLTAIILHSLNRRLNTNNSTT